MYLRAIECRSVGICQANDYVMMSRRRSFQIGGIVGDALDSVRELKNLAHYRQ